MSNSTANASTTASTGSECTLSCSIAKIVTLHSLLSDRVPHPRFNLSKGREAPLTRLYLQAVKPLFCPDGTAHEMPHCITRNIYVTIVIRLPGTPPRFSSALDADSRSSMRLAWCNSCIRSSVSAMYASANGFKQYTSAKWLLLGFSASIPCITAHCVVSSKRFVNSLSRLIQIHAV